MVRYTGLCFLIVGLLLRSCTAVKKDVIWLVDASSAVSTADHELVVDFIYNVTTHLTIGPSDVRMAVITYDEETNKEFELDENDVKNNLLSAINGITANSNPASDRKTMDALTYTKTIFLASKGGRDDAAKAIIAIVGGTSTDTSATISVSNELRTTYGAELFSIGIGESLSSTNTELKGIANDPDTYYMEYIGSYSYLCGLIPSLVPKIDNETTAPLLDGCEIWTEPGQEEAGQGETYRKINTGLSGGAIAGLVLASLFILAMLSLMLYFLYRRKKKKVQHEENQKDDNIINAVNDYGNASLGEKNHIFKRDYSTGTVTPTKPIDDDSPFSLVYETLGERSAASSVVNVRIPE